MSRCTGCGCREYGGAPDCTRCLALLDGLVEEGWRGFLRRGFGTAEPSPEEEAAIAGMVAEEPDRHDWRVVDAALDRLACTGCGSRLGRGPRGCPPCDLADGFRYSAVETDRPGVPPGNEHAVRVGVSVLRAPHRQSPHAVLGWRVGLPVLLEGFLPTTAQAQAMRARINAGAAYEELEGIWEIAGG
ncbi:hypothetical protein [Planomonospora venezuelensis]|uniref:Uncharacterized protein n=1 Tax=Planomonospora venezuelensis TaxID=1999 RepID=A0A841D8A5_PLAVE|nr:hypothetical protein [Planomonospora venezuelensis]GIM99210.1 hypothetical protein Pve01_08690 [Planomonospora venezuelensis]